MQTRTLLSCRMSGVTIIRDTIDRWIMSARSPACRRVKLRLGLLQRGHLLSGARSECDGVHELLP